MQMRLPGKICLLLIMSSLEANAASLSPLDFNHMYALAAQGNKGALSAAQNRGLNIDAVNSEGDTGLCVAARFHNATAYSSFRSAGANPNHPCTWDIPDYKSFVYSYAVQKQATWYDSGYVETASYERGNRLAAFGFAILLIVA